MIKLFEDFSHELYYQVDEDSFTEMNRKTIPFTKRDIDTLAKVGFNVIGNYTTSHSSRVIDRYTLSRGIYRTNNGGELTVNTLEDDYYLLKFNSSYWTADRYYKCDQMDGLLACLSDQYRLSIDI